jgi:hypothetical protein
MNNWPGMMYCVIALINFTGDIGEFQTEICTRKTVL